MEEYTIYTDGACDNMSQLDGGTWAFVVVKDNKVVDTSVGFQRIATNNQMELQAIFRAFNYVSPNSKVHIITDSKYCIGMLSQGWKPKANHSLIALIKRIIEDKTLTVSFEWVRGHSGDYFNEMADELASKEYKERTGKYLPEHRKEKDLKIDYRAELFELYCIVDTYLNCERLYTHDPEKWENLMVQHREHLDAQMKKVNSLTQDCF